MTPGSFRILPLDGRDRSGFDCASEALSRYFHAQVTQDVRRRIAASYIALHQAADTIAGFYTLSAADILLTELPAELTRRLPRYPTLPAARLGRLAIDHRFTGQKLGATLLADAILRAAGSEVAVFAMVVDAKDAQAEAFYRHHGFAAYSSAPGRLVAPLASLLPRA
ncbi:MAG TPA: GNAT family N-acetyltransferase [Albidovulum sp.]|uniref:GNAT family N-acetyltransferase n=1 Tax=Albidovulum sp. TaxID=1872424 RepID=UPI002C3C3432|nr:GNAT family N-acetyltransferase [Albidovulum sp.]